MTTRCKSKISNRNEQKNESHTDLPAAPIKCSTEAIHIEESGDPVKTVATQQELVEFADCLNKIKSLQTALELDILACDAKWTLFVTAAFSYRYDIKLQPFPSKFASEQMGCDIDSLLKVITDVPQLSMVLKILNEEAYHELTFDVIELLHWVLIRNAEPILRLVTEEEELNSILDVIDNKAIKSQPTHVFKVNSTEGFHSETVFESRIQNLPLKLAFMGNKLDIYYSILQNGFSKGTENKTVWNLSTDLHTSLLQSPFCAAWGKSQCGSIIRCAAICEFAFNTECDKVVVNENDASCVDIYLKKPENIRLRYLIFYGRRFSRYLLPRRGFFSWLYNYRFSFSFMLLLVTIGLVHTKKGECIMFHVVEKLKLLLSFCRKYITEGP